MRFVAVLFFILLICVVAAMSYGYWIERPVVLGHPITVTIAAGEGTPQIATALADSGLIRSRRIFIWMARLRSIDRHLQPGRYQFEGSVRLSDILDQLRYGRAMIVPVTIPEGWTLKQIAEEAAQSLGFSADSLLSMASDPAVLAQWTQGANSLEGYLFPETYQFYWGVSDSVFLNALLDKANDMFNDSLEARADSIGWTRHQVLTLASMIEAEAADGAERALISGVFHNRLTRGWLMQCDPTVVYAIGGLPEGRLLTTKDLGFDSPYNTYLYPGLPPGPICNPGYASLWAALYPAATEAMYFVADGRGAHIFSRTLDEHNQARVRVKQNSR